MRTEAPLGGLPAVDVVIDIVRVRLLDLRRCKVVQHCVLVLLVMATSHVIQVLEVVLSRRLSWRREEVVALMIALRLSLPSVLAGPAAVLLVPLLFLLEVVGVLAQAVDALADAARLVLAQVLLDDALLVYHLLDRVLLVQLRERELFLLQPG